MRPLYLKIAGLNSFREEQVIDFTNLCETGIFGIFGPTGSGKSTILDGITLALYGKVERAKGGTQAIINQHEDKAYVYFAFSLGERKFKAERTYKKSSDGGVNMQNCRLIEDINGEEVVLAEKRKDMEEKVQEILGLNVTDFTRAVVLPQGKFAEFLSLQGTERRKMLQRLFGLEQYGEQLSQKIKGRIATVANSLETVIGRQSELGDASESSLKDSRGLLKEQDVKLKELQEHNKEIKKRDEEYKEIISLQDELKEVEAKKELLEEKKSYIEGQEEKYELALRAMSIKPFLDRVNDEQILLDKTTTEIQHLTIEKDRADQDYQDSQQRQAQWQEIVNTQGKELEIHLAKLEEAFINEENRDRLNTRLQKLRLEYKGGEETNGRLKKEIEKLEEKNKELQSIKSQLNTVIKSNDLALSKKEEIIEARERWQSLQQVEKIYQDIDKDIKDKTAQQKALSDQNLLISQEVSRLASLIQQKEHIISQLPPEGNIHQEINQVKDDLNSLDRLINALEFNYQELHNKEQNREASYNEIKKLKARVAQYETNYSTLSSNKEQMLEEVQQLEKIYKSLERSNLAYFLSQNLLENQPCPVCGSPDHPQPIKQGVEDKELTDISNTLSQKQLEIQKLEGEINNLNSHQTILKTQITSLEANTKNLEEEEANIRQRITLAYKQAKEDWSQVGLEVLQNIYQEKKELLNSLEPRLQSLIADKNKFNQEINDLKNKLNGTKEKLAADGAKEEALIHGIKELEARLGKIEVERDKRRQEFIEKAKTIPGDKIEETYNRLMTLTRENDKLREEEKQAATQLEDTYQKLLAQYLELQNSQLKLDTLKNEGTSLSNQVKELTDRINQITRGKGAKEAQKEGEEELNKIVNSFKEATTQLEKSRKMWETQQNLHNLALERLSQSRVRLQEGKGELDKKLQEYNFISQEQLVVALCTKEELQDLKVELDNFKEEKALIYSNMERLNNKLAGRVLSNEEWQHFLKEKEQSQAELDQALELVHKLQDRLEALERNHKRWKELEGERKALKETMDKLAQLEKLFRGNTFVEFIAEEQLFNVAMAASQRLGELTHYRYSLEVDSEGGFVIRDDGNGGLRRPVATLSGGETFLTSLALALALSSQIQLRGQYPLEFFFLDEGFGTLDSYLLETVINSLERIRSNNLTIGVISHVPELKARMARRLIVEGAEKGGRGTTLQIQYA